MNLRKKLIAMVAAGTLVAGLTFAAAGHHHMDSQTRLNFLAAHLNLTDAQKASAQTIFDQAKQEAQPIVAQLKQEHQAVTDAVKAGKSDAEISALANQQGVLVGQLAAVRAKAMAHLYAQLTPDQKTKADQLQEMMKQRFQRHTGAGPQAPGE